MCLWGGSPSAWSPKRGALEDSGCRSWGGLWVGWKGAWGGQGEEQAVINSPTPRAGLLFNGGVSLPRRIRGNSRTSQSMAEDLGLGFGETASVEMLPEHGSCRPKARSRLASGSGSARWALTCCLVSLSILAGLTTYLLIGQLRAQGEACVFQVSKTPW